MESLGRILISLMVETKISLEAGSGGNNIMQMDREKSFSTKISLEAGSGGNNIVQMDREKSFSKKISAREKKDNLERKRTTNFGLRGIMRALSEDDSWQAKQAKRKREKEDNVNNNPSFDPIFMKI